ncbi:MAG TPA: prolyl oligopeptidase family serine peptidase [Pirellulaceae bacterium]|nr:prolyl oligopeptidase family serine peptidase [Pirellulaceae bacterium]HMO93328.1 prolyl oligopeptidase family serine peptidase [Pirellulaceae bacterium]HMP69133.1 prolyl oligopeptidase family serine peptidase [Pirellulaceae bacterium]
MRLNLSSSAPTLFRALALVWLTYLGSGSWNIAAQDLAKQDSTEAVKDNEEQKSENPAHVNQPGAVQPQDYGKFEQLVSGDLSPDGRWLAYAIRLVNGDAQLRIRMLATDATDSIDFATSPKFAGNSEWLAFLIGISASDAEKKEKAKEPIRTKLGLRNLITGHKTEIDNVASFAFSEDGRFLVMNRYPMKDRKSSGVDLVLRDLNSNIDDPVDTNFGNVAAYAFNDKGLLLAMVIDAEEQAGNGLQVYDCHSGILRTLDSSPLKYAKLSWRKDADDLAVMREFKREEKEDSAYAVLAWRGLQSSLLSGKPQKIVYDPLKREAHPNDLRIVDFADLKWSDDGTTLFFGLKEWNNKPKSYGVSTEEAKKTENASDKPADESSKSKPDAEDTKQATGNDKTKDETAEQKPANGKPEQEKDKEKAPRSLRESLTDPADVEVWHARDIEIIPLQKKQIVRDQNQHFLAAWWLDDDKLVQLGNELTERVTLFEHQKRALGYDNTPYEEQKRFGPTLNDLYLIDVLTGERNLIVPGNKYAFSSSPDGRYFVYQKSHQLWLYDSETDSHRNLTGDLGPAFHNTRMSTLTEEKPPWAAPDWTQDSSYVLLYDEFDIWYIAIDSTIPAQRLTDGADNKIQHRRISFDPIEDRWVDPAKPLFLSMFGDRTKKSGFGRLDLTAATKRCEKLIWKDMSVSRLIKAKDADTFAFVEQSVEQSPNIWVASENLVDARVASDTNPFQKNYLWSRAELIDFVNENGEELQGALYYPAGYESGKKYPMIVYIYEERSQAIHNFAVPSEQRPYNNATFTADGYFVFEPDIVYRPQNPGLSAVECVVPAVRKVLESGMIDETKIGLIGHSWGAYQTAFIVTQTDLFAAGIAGAPLTNMMSMSMSIYWNSGQTDAWIFFESQGRMNQPFWRDVETYIKNSPIFSVDNLNTPLLVAFGDEDGAVDFNQGVELYNAARLAGKQFVMLVYPGENHGLVKKPNQVDYHYRIREWFGHYLKGYEPASWITEGQKHLDRQKELEKLKKPEK